jgi:hypothetical protein
MAGDLQREDLLVFGGIQMIVSEVALKESNVRLFPASKNRSARIHKKLVKRFGGEFKKVPAIWQIEDRLVVHPALMHTVRQAIVESRKEPSLANPYDVSLPPALMPARSPSWRDIMSFDIPLRTPMSLKFLA